MAVTLTALLGFAGLGTDVVVALYKQRQMQSVASAAAFSGAIAKKVGSDPTTEARGVAAKAGYVNGTGGVTVTVNAPPLSGGYTGTSTAVEVIVAQPQNLPLVGLIQSGSWNISARAVAKQSGGGGDGCVMALDPGSATGTSIDATTVTNGATVTMNQCGLIVNADGGKALDVTGGAVLTAKSVSVFGAISVSGGATINAASGSWNDPLSVTGGGAANFTNTSIGSEQRVADPYAGTPIPTTSTGGTSNAVSLNHCNTGQPACPDGIQRLTPGIYNSGITMGNDAIVQMAPGVYIVNGGQFNIGGNVQLTGSGVTIVLANGSGGYATVVIGNGAHVTLSAPTSGATSGLLFFQDPNAPTSGTNNFQGGATEILTGALYFPHQTAVYSNGTTNTSTCTQLIAWHLQFIGGSLFNSNCGSAGVSSIGSGGPIILVE
jgi:hypothetical protein